MNDWVDLQQLAYLLAASMAFILLLFIIVIALWVRINRMRKAYITMMNSIGVTNLEHVMIELRDSIELASEKLEHQRERLEAVETSVRSMQSQIGIKKFNAFEEVGSRLSFSIAMLSEEKDGIVLTGIHTRDGTHMYAKPIEKGESAYRLTPEEQEAISLCVPPERKPK